MYTIQFGYLDQEPGFIYTAGETNTSITISIHCCFITGESVNIIFFLYIIYT